MDMNATVIWSPGMSLDTIEKEVILKAFRFFRGNKTATATALGIAIRTLDNKLERYEAEGKLEVDQDAARRLKQSEFITRQRGVVPDNVGIPAVRAAAPASSSATSEGLLVRTDAGVRVESASQPAEKPSVSVPKRPEVQSVLPKSAAQGDSRKAR